MDAVLTKAISEGLGYALFVILLFYVLKKQETRDTKSEKREINYQNIITDLTKKFEIINVISSKLDKVEDKIEEVLRK
jgi:hypothetical protein